MISYQLSIVIAVRSKNFVAIDL